MTGLLQDVRYALRQLRKSPGFTAVAVITLALGIGANTAIFSVIDAVLLRSLPYPEQDRLVLIHDWSKQDPYSTVSYLNFLDWRTQQKSFTAMGLARSVEFNYAGPAESERLRGASASYDLFKAIGVPPLRGRLFSAEDDRPGAERTAIIRASLWKRMFGGRDSAIGERIMLSGEAYTIIGVLPNEFTIPLEGAEVWTPFSLSLTDNGNDLKQYGYRGDSVYAYARLKPGVSIESARSAMRILAAQIEKEHPSGGFIPAVLPLATARAGDVRPMLFVLLSAAGFVLLIACANVANLQLARAQARSQEFGVRAALGSGRGRIIRQLLVEGLVLGLSGSGAGLVLGAWILSGLKALFPSGASRVSEASLNGPVLVFAIVIGMFSSLLFSLAPVFYARRQNVREALVQGSRSVGSSKSDRWRAALIMGEFALTIVLLISAGLMIRTLGNLYQKTLGFGTEHLVTFNWMPSGGRYENSAARYWLTVRALERLSTLPGVTRAGLVKSLPLVGTGNTVYCVKGAPPNEYGRMPNTEYNVIDGDYFGALGVEQIAGRAFNAHDDWHRSPPVVIVDTLFAQKEFPGKNPVGQHFWPSDQPPAREDQWYEIVGVVAHVNHSGPASPSGPMVYFSNKQTLLSSVNFIVRTDRDPAALVPSLRAGLREVSGDLPIANIQTMDQLFAANVSTQRLVVTLLGAFAALALLLAAIGLFGVLSYTVGQRTREIGVRMALGATPASVGQMVLATALKLAAGGIGVGLLAAFGVTRFLMLLLYEVSALDPLTFTCAVLMLVGLGLLACWIPARRAAKVDPMVALRYE